MAYVITDNCTKDALCVDVCPTDCIHPKKDEASFDEVTQLYVHPTDCVDCGACVPVCPVQAIFPQDELPDNWKNYTELNVAHYKK